VPFVGDIESVPATIIIILNLMFGMGGPVLIVQGILTFLKLIPVIQEIPLWTIGWIVTWRIETHPSELGTLLEQGAQLAGEFEGGPVSGAEEFAAEGASEAVAEEAAQAEAGAAAGAEAGAAAGSEATENPELQNNRPSEEAPASKP